MMMYPLETPGEVNWLVNRLRLTGRPEPIVVVATHRPELDPLHHAQILSEELTGMAEVYLLAEKMFGYFTKRVGNSRHKTLDGGIHLYEPNWEFRQGIAANTFSCTELEDWPRITSKLVDMIQCMNRYGNPSLYVPISGHWREDTARVEAVLSKTRVRVRLNSGGTATMLAVALKPGVDAHLLVRRGQEFKGLLQTGKHERTFSPFPLHDDVAGRAKQMFERQPLALARVRSVNRRKARIELHPELSVMLRARPFQNLKRKVTKREVIHVVLSWKGDTCVARLARPSDEARSLSVIPGGPAWLRVGPAEQPEAQPHVPLALTA